MKLGVISDIHSNIHAFRACTEFMEKEGCEEYLFLGDFISDTPYTRETLDYLYEFRKNHCCYLCRGNREEYMLFQRQVRMGNVEGQEWIYNSASGNLLYTYEQLEEADFTFLENLPLSFVYEKGGYPAITCCHGSPGNTRELLQINGEPVKHWLDRIDTDYLLCAHTHYPGGCVHHGKFYYNTGCVGIAIGDAGFAQCMILEEDWQKNKVVWNPRFLKIPYDNRKVVRDIMERGLLEKASWFMNSNIQILLTGADHSAELVAMAVRLAKEKNKQAEWPLIDESYFKLAAETLGIPDYRGMTV